MKLLLILAVLLISSAMLSSSQVIGPGPGGTDKRLYVLERNVEMECYTPRGSEVELCDVAILQYNKYLPNLTLPRLRERATICDSRFCGHFGDYDVDIDNTGRIIVKGVPISNSVRFKGLPAPVQDEPPTIEGRREMKVENMFGPGIHYNLGLNPDVVEPQLIFDSPGLLQWTMSVTDPSYAYNATDQGIYYKGNWLAKLHEPECWDVNQSYIMIDEDGEDTHITYNVRPVLGGGFSVRIFANLTYGTAPYTCDPVIEFNQSTFGGVQDTYLADGKPNNNYGTNQRLRVYVGAAGLNANSLVGFDNVTALNPYWLNESIWCRVNDSWVQATFAQNLISYPQTHSGTVNIKRMRRNWTEGAATWNNKTTSCGSIEQCAWNVTGATGQHLMQIDAVEHDTATLYDRAILSAIAPPTYYWDGTSKTDDMFKGNPSFSKLVQKWVNGTFHSYENGMQWHGSGNLIAIIRSSDYATVAQRPELHIQCIWETFAEEDTCSPPASGTWWVNDECQLANEGLINITPRVLHINTTGWINASGTTQICAGKIRWEPKDTSPFRARWQDGAKIRWGDC